MVYKSCLQVSPSLFTRIIFSRVLSESLSSYFSQLELLQSCLLVKMPKRPKDCSPEKLARLRENDRRSQQNRRAKKLRERTTAETDRGDTRHMHSAYVAPNVDELELDNSSIFLSRNRRDDLAAYEEELQEFFANLHAAYEEGSQELLAHVLASMGLSNDEQTLELLVNYFASMGSGNDEQTH
ncbi:hypothetical protein BKA81DRAFT_347501 [Phyllosticta paracitricarpa]